MAIDPGSQSVFPGSAARCVGLGLVFLIVDLVAGPAAAHDTGTADQTLRSAASVVFSDTLTVNSRALPGPVNPSVSGLVTVVDLAEEPPGRDAADLLGGVAGFQVRRYGAVGASAVPSLRGSSAAQIRFYLDGVPLNGAQNGTADLDRIPLDRMATIEIHRGVVPIGLGSVGGAGAVNFISRTGDEGLDFRIGAGSFGELGGRLSAGLVNAAGTLSGTVMVNGLRADNDFEYLDHNQTFYNSADDTVRTRENAWLERWGVWAAGAYESGSLAVRASLGHDRRDGGRPGPLGYPSPGASVRYDRTDGQLHVDHRDGLLQLRLGGGSQEEFLYDPQGEVGFGPPGTDRSLSHDVNGTVLWAPVPVPGLLSVQAGVEGRREWRNDWISGEEEPRRNRTTWSAFAAATVELFDDRVQIAPACRWQLTQDNFPPTPPLPWLPEEDAVDHRREDLSPALGVVWTMVRDRLFLESHLARTVRQPTWVELFGHQGGVHGNRNLLPETISSADAAFSYRSGTGGWSGRIAGFYAETDDKIIFVQHSPQSSQAENAGHTRARGIELELAAILPGDFSLTGNFTWQRAEDLGGLQSIYAGNRLPFLPDTEAQVRLGRPMAGWRPWFEAAYMGANYRDRANTELNKAPARTVLNIGLARDWRPRWLGSAGALSLSAEIVNVTDNAVYDVEGFPLPGRSWRAAIRLRN